MKSSRPYRSRKIPACTRCHARRSKCTIEHVGESCRLCQMTGAECSAAALTVTSSRCLTKSSPVSAAGREITDVHVVSPMVARDTQVLEDFLPNTDVAMISTGHREQKLRPVYHIPVPPRRPSPTQCDCSKDLPTKFMGQIEPYLDQLIDLYFTKIQSCLPIVDAQSLRSHLKKTNKSSQTLLVTFAAYMLFYWNHSVETSQAIDLDQDFAWQAACLEIKADVQTNDLSSIVSTVISVAGRPSTGLIHNMTNVARNVATSNSIGLNYDCSNWRIPEADKELRQRLWWAVLIHDRWFHFAQGTPPLINTSYYDVSVPNMSLLIGGNVDACDVDRLRSFQGYIAFCELTEIVGEMLPLIYHVRFGNTHLNTEKISKSRSDLDEWLQNLPKELNFDEDGKRPNISGLANLQLAYLASRMLLTRLTWYEKSQTDEANDEVLLHGCQVAAEAVADFVIWLQPHELFGFWLPYNAQHFISAITLLLRCALQTKYVETRERCIKVAKDFVGCLRSYQQVYGWDMAETALPQCETIWKRIEEALPKLRATEMQRVKEDRQDERRDETTTDENTFGVNQCFDAVHQASLEELFPEVFSTLGDYTFFDQIPLHNDLASD